MMIARRRAAMEMPERVLHCRVCKKHVDRHTPSCPLSFSETARRDAVIRAGINPNDFYRILLVLQQKYPGGFTG